MPYDVDAGMDDYVVTGPEGGHWYAVYQDELYALPTGRSQPEPPPHPAIDPNLDRVAAWRSIGGIPPKRTRAS